MSRFTPTMTWAIEQAIQAALEAQGSKYGSTMREAVRDASIRECEKTNGEGGVKASTLVSALRIACANLDQERAKYLLADAEVEAQRLTTSKEHDRRAPQQSAEYPGSSVFSSP